MQPSWGLRLMIGQLRHRVMDESVDGFLREMAHGEKGS